ncbi:hypothetical protein IV494_08595 [Kaistella sp. G5-32]|uniref:Uncharacterized protein n=1 Tax=Kaistella gelatinilytica TaxID=2787636 RepID=A0ABS0FBZ5_9FLAO|nr:hypothetical protein [Kaistella gelatinilytica]MBF8457240.1 hypothetical protein [Kaistella gelatinilytica]
MKTFKFLKINFMLVVALLTAGITMSFKLAEKNSADTAYYYISEDMSEGSFHNVNNWTTASSGGADCVTTGDRPCKVIVPENSSLGSVLGSKNNSQVLAISVNRKLEP